MEQTLTYVDSPDDDDFCDDDDDDDDYNAAGGDGRAGDKAANDDDKRSEYQPSPEKKAERDGSWSVYSMEEMRNVVAFWRSGKTGKLKLQTVQARYRKVRDRNHLDWMAQKVDDSGSRWEKLDAIAAHVDNCFRDAIAHHARVHDADLAQWAMAEADRLSWNWFKCSHSWVQKFKREHRIASRAITHVITRKSAESADAIEKSACDFVSLVKADLVKFFPSQVLNTDQSGFNKELHSHRILAPKGVRHVQATVQSESATTHSYTIQPLVSAAGELYSPMLIVLQEQADSFGPLVAAKMMKPDNLYIKCSKSGNVTRKIIDDWFMNVYFPHAPKESVLLVDSLGMYKNRNDMGKPDDVICQLRTIPPHCTPLCQPLGVFFFRQWKAMAKRIVDQAVNSGSVVSMFQRDNLLKLQSLINNQFSAPIFAEYRKRAWMIAGYIPETTVAYDHPVKYCFQRLTTCSDDDCNSLAVIRCSWCSMQLCFPHFLSTITTIFKVP